MNIITSLYSSHYFSTLHFVLIVTHVTAALLALVIAPLAMITQKGGRAHRRWGTVYLCSMITTNMVAFSLLFWRFNVFLFAITVLSLYAAVTGARVLQQKRPLKGQGPTWFDWGFACIALLTGIGLFAWGALGIAGIGVPGIPSGSSLSLALIILPLFFGFAIVQSAWRDLRRFRRPSSERKGWWYLHMDRMLGSYIALVTALMVQQVGPRLPGSMAWMVWVAPAAIGSPLIGRWIRHYRRRFEGGRTGGVAEAEGMRVSV